MTKNEVRLRLTELCENRLSQLRFEIEALRRPGALSAKGVLDALIALGHLEEAISKLDGLGADVAQWRQEFAKLTQQLDATVRPKDKRIYAELSQAALRTAHLLASQLEKEIADKSGSTEWIPFGGFSEFDQFLWGLDAGQYAERALGRLGWPARMAPWSQIVIERRHELESLIGSAVERIVQLSDAENPHFEPTTLYPDRFWWRALAWEAYRRLQEDADVQ